jgi:hypothetical protein
MLKNLEYTFLKKNEFDKILFYREKDKFYKFSKKEFYKFFEVEYLKNVYIEKLKTLKNIIKACDRGKKLNVISKKEIWLGIYYGKEILNGIIPDVYIKWIGREKGFGLFAKKDLKKGKFIGVYTGLLRKHNRFLDRKNSYCFEYQTGFYKKTPYTVDAKYMGNYTRFINHNFIPNLNLYNAYLYGITHIILVTNEFVKKDSELFYDYGENYWKKREEPIFQEL